MKYYLTQLPYTQDSTLLFDKIASLPWAIFLDSCQPHSKQGRYDIMSAMPYKTLLTHGASTTIATPTEQIISFNDPFQLVKNHMFEANFESIESLPFSGGALGYFGYDLAERIEPLPVHPTHSIPMPSMAIGLYAWAIIVDHQEKRSWCFAQKTISEFEWKSLLNRLESINPSQGNSPPSPLQLLQPLKSSMTQQQYNHAFNTIQNHIYEGDCYQVNLAQCFNAPIKGDSWQTYLLLRQTNPAPYAAFISIPQGNILSLSPEQFLRVQDGFIQTKPIKGTRPRGKNFESDALFAAQLLKSEKDRAENLMIVDLLRNDLGKNCIPGSIQVPHLFALESFAAVHHLVSTVTGHLNPKQHSIDLLRNCFPGGSVTGAPKKRAMEIIVSTEPQHRSTYCGAIGYIDHQGNMETNIVIRTFIICRNHLYCYAGGALVADSTAEEEYQETFTKVAKLMEVLKNIS